MPAVLAISFVFRRTLVPSGGASSVATSATGFPPRSGWQIGQNDSGNPCSSQKSPLARNTAISAGLHLVQTASRTPCSLHIAPSAEAVFFSSRASAGASASHAASAHSKRMAVRISAALRRPDDLQIRVALQALRLGKTVLLAPVARRLEGSRERRI